MSHHLDSPASRQDPRLNLTDMYVFDGEAGTVFIMVTNTSLAGETHLRGFHPEGRYEVKIHLGDGPTESLTYRVSFGPPDGAALQDLRVELLEDDDAARDDMPGAVVAHGRTGDVVTGDRDALRVWAGTAADPFYLDLNQLGHILEGLQHRQPIDLEDWTVASAQSSFTGSNVSIIVLEVPTTDARLSSGTDLLVWGTTKLATDAGGWRQINRAAIPMMWPIFRAMGGDDDSADYGRDTTSHPSEDRVNDEARVSDIVTAAAEATGTRDPKAYGRLIAERLLPDLLPYRVGTPAAFAFAGFNGRSLADNAPEVMYGLITNSALPTGLTSADAAETRQPGFPYVVPTAS